ncbi:2TM domain-containing protein [Polaribacter sargassicola]|uniref:2TM domain-containing protein n=1 Tax=Polaribacter sargassicola TaxID=2836891 RepID=UPI001F343FF0|nr:2TM domain-containing protein [Polaribacter sp. DS7-9]MCG1036682.1 2TM domain-containing protein [Polaribacter sp. DS7-9]
MIRLNSSVFKKIKSDSIISLKLAIVIGIIFIIINQQFSLKGIGLTFLISAMYSFTLGLGNGIVNEFLNSKWDWVEETNQRVWAGIISTVVYTVIAVLIIHYVQYILFFGYKSENFFSGTLILIHLFAIVFSLGVAVFFHAKGFMENWKIAMTKETTEQQIVAKTETAKFESLKSQIDPHFLFNSLNVLTSLIGENPAQAEKFTTKLSKVYRYVLEQRNKDLTTLTEELTFAKTYMQLLEMRFEDAVKFNIPDKVSNIDLKIVPLSLQLLLENAVKHNVVSSSKPLEISIYEENDYLIIENNINPKEAIGKSTKVGLQNIADRYGLITQKGVKIENNNKTFKVSLPLLYKINDIMNTNDLENSKYVKAVEKVEKLKEFYQNLTSYCIVIPFLIFINLRFSPGFHWFWFPLFGWGMGLTFHFLEVNNYSVLLGKNWEDKKIKELMDKENQRKNYK